MGSWSTSDKPRIYYSFSEENSFQAISFEGINATLLKLGGFEVLKEYKYQGMTIGTIKLKDFASKKDYVLDYSITDNMLVIDGYVLYKNN